MSSEATSTLTPEERAVPLRTSVLLTLRTLPEARLMFSEEPKLSPVASNWKVLSPSPESTVIPAPSAAASLAAPVAIWMFLSSILTVVELMVVVVPSTWRSPAITTVPVLSPTPAGSSVRVAGPEIVSLVTRTALPSAPVANTVAVMMPEAVACLTPASPETVRLPDTVSLPVTARVEPLKVRLPLSSSSPPEPARTTRPSVRSLTAALLSVAPPVTVRPEAMLAPPSTSRAPVTVAPADTTMSVVPSWLVVVIPVAWRFTKLAPAPPPRT